MTVITPREKRDSVFLLATVHQPDAAGVQVHRVRNISPRGACLEWADGITIGSVVTLSIGQVASVSGRIVWVRDGWAGLHFEAPIDVMAARRRSRAVGDFPWAPRLLGPSCG